MQDERTLNAGGEVEEGRNELLPAGVTRRAPADARKESDLSVEELAETLPRPDPLAGASNSTVDAIRKIIADDAGAHATMPAPGRRELSDEELARRAARRETLTGDASAGAHGESFGGEVATVEESRRRLLAGQVPAAALGASGADADYAVRDAGAARLHAMRQMAERATAQPSDAPVAGRIRGGDGGDALRAPRAASPAATSTETRTTPAGGAGTGAGGASGASGASGAGGGQGTSPTGE